MIVCSRVKEPISGPLGQGRVWQKWRSQKMKRALIWTFAGLVLVASQSHATWEFNTDGNREGWQTAHNIAKIEVVNGSLIAHVNAETNDPYISGPTGPYDGDRITGLSMRMRWSIDALGMGGPASYYFPADGGHGSSPYEAPPPGEWHVVNIDYYEDVGGDRPVDWGGMINSVRIDLADNAPEDYTVEIDWIRYRSEYIENESFVWGDLWAWEHTGAGDISSYVVTDSNFFSMDFAVEAWGLGSDNYHALEQAIYQGETFEVGTSVAVLGALYVPSSSWDADSHIWFRIREYDGTTENISPPIEVTTFDEWFQFESRVELQFEPAERESLSVQLYSKNPTDTAIYFDDIFVDVAAPGEDDGGSGGDGEQLWAWADSNWEFNTDGDTEGWTIGNEDAIEALEAVDGSLVVYIPAGVEDPYINGPQGPFNADHMSGAAVRMRISSGAEKGGYENFWFGVDGGIQSKVYAPPVAGEWFVLYQDLSDNWEGWFNNFRYDFANFYDEDTVVEIDWIRFIDEWIDNNGFEESLEPWGYEGAGDMGAFSLSSDQVFSGETALAITGLGSSQYHAAQQNIEDGLEIPKGAVVTLKGYYYVPAGSWDDESHIWFRIKEYDGNVENLSEGITEPVLDEWTPFEYSITLQYEPSQRTEMRIQLYSRTPDGTMIYADDVFATVSAPAPETGWPVNAVRLSDGQEIVIDGNVSAEEYAGAQALVMNAETLNGVEDPYFEGYIHGGVTHPGGSQETSLEDFSATYYFMWDDEFFYAAVSAQDDNYSFVGPDPNGSDALQFTFSETPEETDSNRMYIPTIAPDDGAGNIVAKNDFGGWITHEIMGESEYAATVDYDTNDWMVEVKIPWSAMQGDFANEVFPPNVGDQVGFSVCSIDYDEGELQWFGTNGGAFPWESQGVQPLYFIEETTSVEDWSIR